MDEPAVLAVFAAAFATALATGLGAGPFLFVAHLARSWVGVANALAAGFMIAASGLLFYEGARDSATISLVLVPQGVGVLRAAGWSVFSSLPQPLVAVPAFLFVAFFDGLVPLGLGFAGGAMLWMVAAQIVPDALTTTSRRAVTLALAGSAAAMVALEALLLT